MDKLAAIQAFVKVVEQGGFAAAARTLGLSRSAVNKYVIALENQLGVQLLQRSTRQVSATTNGRAYYGQCVAILADLAEAERALADTQHAPRGSLKINAPMSFGTLHLAPLVADFMARYRELRVQLTLNDRFVDPIEEGFDLTIRIADLPDSSLIARKLGPAPRVLCASPAYLAAHGTPAHPRELRRHACLHYGYLASGNQWKLNGPDGRHAVPIDGLLCSNNAEVLCVAAVKGLGIALLPIFIAEPALRTGELAVVLAEYAAPASGIYAVYPPNRRLAMKVRLFIDFLVEWFDHPAH